MRRSPIALLALFAVMAAASNARAQALRRFAIVAGNDTGGGDTRSLLYAGADARKVYDILTRLGGVQQEDATLLIGASASQLLSAMVAVEMQAAEAKRRGERTALLFYYSGHAKDGSLRLWQVPPAERPPALWVLPEQCRTFAISPDSRRLVTVGDDYVLWDLDTGAKLLRTM